MFGGKFGKAGDRVVIEEYLSGIECSVFVATDGKNYKILPVAKDYKRIGEGDTGLNTGGMGAVSPVPFADAEFMRKVEERIVRPTVAGLEADKIDYHGFVFIGLMNCDGDPYVIEYNVRMGDPETEVVLPRIESDIMELFEGIAFGQLDEVDLRIDPRTAVTVVCVSGGYPEAYEKGKEISGLELPTPEGTKVYHAGTAAKAGATLTSGGRVLAVTSLAEDIPSALAKSYGTIEQINYEGKYCRRDIGQDVMRYGKE
jgi:phosphoribosylamine--glycine ligase